MHRVTKAQCARACTSKLVAAFDAYLNYMLSMPVYRLLESIEIVVHGHLNNTHMAHE